MPKLYSLLGKRETPKGTLVKLIAGVRTDEAKKTIYLQAFETLWPKELQFPENWPVSFTVGHDIDWTVKEEELPRKEIHMKESP
jgi:hypothetical protein